MKALGGTEHSEMLRALSHQRRFDVLEILIEEQSLGLAALTHRLVDKAESINRDEVERVQVSLYHRHLPHLTETGLVHFDEAEETVAITETATETFCEVHPE